jgi:deoxynucleoside triphosphate triphosphohydrolase SAMHD1
MIVDALLSAEPHLHFAELVDKPDKYVHLCDNIIQRIEMSEDPELETSRSILSRITTRDLYKCVDYKTLPWVYKEKLRETCTPEIIVKAAKAYEPTTDAERKLVDELEAKHVIVDVALLHYGKQTHFARD